MYLFQNKLKTTLIRFTLTGLRCNPSPCLRHNFDYRFIHSTSTILSKTVRQKPPKSNKQAAQPSLRHVPTSGKGTVVDQENISKPQSPQQQDHLNPYHHTITGLSTQLRTCTTVSTCEHYDLATAVDLLYKMGLRSASILLPGEMVHVKYPFGAGKVADVLILSNGTVIAWGMNESEVMDQVVPALELAEIRHYKVAETEDMDYVEEVEGDISEENNIPNPAGSKSSNEDVLDNQSSASIASSTPLPSPSQTSPLSPHPQNHSTMVGDVIYIRGDNPTSRLLDKAAFSSGLARNTKLAALEISLDNYIKSIKELSDNLAAGRKIELRGSEVLQITGRLLQIRGHLNLYSELIETPDLYWSEPQLEQLYTLISRKLDITPRIAILNKRLDYASELAGILKTHISEEQSTRLEWMIIILITVEVCFEIVHFVEKYWK